MADIEQKKSESKEKMESIQPHIRVKNKISPELARSTAPSSGTKEEQAIAAKNNKQVARFDGASLPLPPVTTDTDRASGEQPMEAQPNPSVYTGRLENATSEQKEILASKVFHGIFKV